MEIGLADAWSWWATGDPGLRDAHLWGLAIRWWGLIGGIVLLLGAVALAMDVAASPRSHDPRRRGPALRVLISAIVVLAVVSYVHAFREEMQETGRSALHVAFAGNDEIDWDAAPRWFNLTLPSLVVLALALWRRPRLQDWLTTLHHKGPKAVLARLLAALLLLPALTLAVLAA